MSWCQFTMSPKHLSVHIKSTRPTEVLLSNHAVKRNNPSVSPWEAVAEITLYPVISTSHFLTWNSRVKSLVSGYILWNYYSIICLELASNSDLSYLKVKASILASYSMEVLLVSPTHHIFSDFWRFNHGVFSSWNIHHAHSFSFASALLMYLQLLTYMWV